MTLTRTCPQCQTRAHPVSANDALAWECTDRDCRHIWLDLPNVRHLVTGPIVIIGGHADDDARELAEIMRGHASSTDDRDMQDL